MPRCRTSHRTSETAHPSTMPAQRRADKQAASLLPSLPPHVIRMGSSSRRALSGLTEQLGGMVVAFWQSTHMSLDMESAEVMRRMLLGRSSPTLHFCLTSGGGSAIAGMVMAELLRSACKRLIVYIPVQACSAASILALAADEIRMAPGAYLSAIDGTVTMGEGAPLNEVELPRLRSRAPKGRPHRDGTVDGYEHLFPHMSPFAIAHALRFSGLTKRICQRLMRHVPGKAKRQRIVNAMLNNCPTHGYPICLDEAKQIGLSAVAMTAKENAAMLALHDLHLSYGRIHRIPHSPLCWRETTMPSIIGTSDHTAAMVADGEMAREKLDTPWQEVWRNNGWRSIEDDGACPRMAVELNGGR